MKGFLSKCAVLKADLLYVDLFRTLKYTVCVIFSLESLQAVAMKGLMGGQNIPVCVCVCVICSCQNMCVWYAVVETLCDCCTVVHMQLYVWKK